MFFYIFSFFLFLPPMILISGEINIEILDQENEKGFIHFALYNQKEKFLSDNGKIVALKKKTNEVVLSGINVKNLEEGYYGIAIYHDENSNDEFDKFLGIPQEKYGFSNDAEVFFGPPSYDDASFKLKKNEIKKIKIKLR